VRAFARRVAQLEKQAFVVAADPIRNPRKHLRIVIQSVARQSGQRDTTCKRTLCPNGTLLEVVEPGDDCIGVPEEELDRIVAGFPVTILGGQVR